ncbi:MAG: hypothetical protein M1838_003979 [Thelocarpon superellum]|nr:MAG: hypothetical protein M1838_003979 [Thelocarpon superellum]
MDYNPTDRDPAARRGAETPLSRSRPPSSVQLSRERSHEEDDDVEKGPGPPPSVNFFSKSLDNVRAEVLIGWLETTLILSVFILGILSLYWAVQFRVEENLSSLLVYVVDFDSQAAPIDSGAPALVGPAVVQAAQAMVDSGNPHLGFLSVPPSMFDNDPINVRQAIYNYDAWAAIVINANATTLLRQAVAQGNTSYDPLGAAQVIYVQARDQTTFSSYVTPAITALESQVQASFGQMWSTVVLQNASDTATLQNLQRVPQAVNPAIGFSTFNLRPFTPPTATPTITIGLIYLIIISFFSFSFYLPIHLKFMNPQGHPPLHFYQLIIWRWVATITAYFILSLIYSLVSLAFQIPFSNDPAPDTVPTSESNANGYGNASFVIYWMLNWVGMIALGLACENVAMVLGMPYTAFWLIFWVITNVSTSFYEISLSPHFYYWGYAWPLHNIVEATRTIIFDVHSRIGLNFGVLFAWCAVNTVVFPFACWFMRWKGTHGHKKPAGESKEERQPRRKGRMGFLYGRHPISHRGI